MKENFLLTVLQINFSRYNFDTHHNKRKIEHLETCVIVNTHFVFNQILFYLHLSISNSLEKLWLANGDYGYIFEETKCEAGFG